MNLLSVGNDHKTVKGEKFGYMTGILYLAPHKESGKNLCPNASAGCIRGCLFTAGHGAYPRIKQYRINKTKRFLSNRNLFMIDLAEDISALIRKAKKNGMKPCVRLNGTSDIPWENISVLKHKNIMEMFPDIPFYDYTKSVFRMVKFLKGEMPQNYHLTFSKSERNDFEVETVLNMGGNVAVVFKEFPKKYMGKPLIDGDKSDLRFKDKKNVVVALKAKGRARTDTTGFVVLSN